MEAFNAAVAAFPAANAGRTPTLEEQRVIMLGLVGNNPGSTAGLRTTSGVLNNLTPGNAAFGSAGQPFINLTDPTYVAGNAGAGFDPDGPTGPAGLITNADYTPGAAAGNNVVDSQPRQISQLISDQSTANPAAVAGCWPITVRAMNATPAAMTMVLARERPSEVPIARQSTAVSFLRSARSSSARLRNEASDAAKNSRSKGLRCWRNHKSANKPAAKKVTLLM